jgi:hypothetical protein
VGLDFPASVVCDKCGQHKTVLKLALTKLKPQTEMHLKLPPGWAVTSLPESGDLYITCPSCPPTLVSIPPVQPEDPATDPTMRPPPLPKL